MNDQNSLAPVCPNLNKLFIEESYKIKLFILLSQTYSNRCVTFAEMHKCEEIKTHYKENKGFNIEVQLTRWKYWEL